MFLDIHQDVRITRNACKTTTVVFVLALTGTTSACVHGKHRVWKKHTKWGAQVPRNRCFSFIMHKFGNLKLSRFAVNQNQRALLVVGLVIPYTSEGEMQL